MTIDKVDINAMAGATPMTIADAEIGGCGMTVDEIIKHCDDYITSMNKYAGTGNIGWWLEFYHTVLNGFRELKALEEQQPSEPRTNLAETSQDCISRQAVLDVINFEDEWLFDAKSHNGDTKIAFSAIKFKISKMPPVTPQRQQPTDAILREIMARIEHLHDAEDIKGHIREFIKENE